MPSRARTDKPQLYDDKLKTRLQNIQPEELLREKRMAETATSTKFETDSFVHLVSYQNEPPYRINCQPVRK